MHVRAGTISAVILTAALLVGCGAKQDTTRRHIATYLAKVNAVQRTLTAPLSTIDAVDKGLTTSTTGSGHGRRRTTTATALRAQERRLAVAHSQIVSAAQRLQALAAPAPAAHLKHLLLRLVNRQADLTEQTSKLLVFIPGFTRSLSPLGGAVTQLERALRVNQASGATAVARVYARKVAALHVFVGQLRLIQGSLARLRPPASSQPTYRTERDALRQMSVGASALAGALAARRTTGLTAILDRFDRAAELPGSRPAQRAEIAAVRAYNREVNTLGALVEAANREQLRLARSFP